MQTVIILGNGKSLDLYREEDFPKDAIILGCNVPPKDIRIDYVCAVDAYAVSHAYRHGQPYHDRLLNEGWKLVLGCRACGGLKGVKEVPGGMGNMLDWLKQEGYLHRKIELFPDAKEIGQRYFSTGHLAYLFACDEWPESEIHMFGFDSLFTGAAVSYTHWNIRRPNDPTDLKRQPKGVTRENPDPTVSEWQWLWTKMLESDRNTAKTINIHGWTHDPDLDYIHGSINVIRHEKVKSDEKL